MRRRELKVVLVGGGRWGRVHAGNLARILKQGDEVIWVSRHGGAGPARHAEARSLEENGAARFRVVDNLDGALAASPTAAIVVTSPASHVAIAERLLQHRVPTLVEKPFALSDADAGRLIDLAHASGSLFAAGLHLLSASYLAHFKSAWSNRRIGSLEIHWHDPAAETRYGEVKRPDVFTPLAHDLYPHVWAIVRVLTNATRQRIIDARFDAGARVFRTRAGEVEVVATLSRQAASRMRRIEVRFADGGSAGLDFTREPGHPFVDGLALPADPSWGHSPTPLVAEVVGFLNQIASARSDPDWPHQASRCRDSVAGAEVLAAMMDRACIAELYQLWRAGELTLRHPPSASLLAELMVPRIAAHDRRIHDLDAGTCEQAIGALNLIFREHGVESGRALAKLAELAGALATRA